MIRLRFELAFVAPLICDYVATERAQHVLNCGSRWVLCVSREITIFCCGKTSSLEIRSYLN